MRTTATPTSRQALILNGEKLWCPNGTRAELLVVMSLTRTRGNGEAPQRSRRSSSGNAPGVEIVESCLQAQGAENGLLRFTN